MSTPQENFEVGVSCAYKAISYQLDGSHYKNFGGYILGSGVDLALPLGETSVTHDYYPTALFIAGENVKDPITKVLTLFFFLPQPKKILSLKHPLQVPSTHEEIPRIPVIECHDMTPYDLNKVRRALQHREP